MDKVQKIREEVARIQLYTKSEVLKQVLDYIDSMQLEEIPPKFPLISQKKCVYTKDDFTDEDRKVLCDGCKEECKYAQKKEPVSKDLEKASKEWLRPQLDKSYAAYGETKQMELTHFDGYAMLDAIEFGAQWQKNRLWKPADGDDLPDVDREVIALVGLEGFFEIPPDEPVKLSYKVVFAHRPPEYWDGKDIVTGKVTRNYPKTYDKGGWNIPNVKFWLDIELPKEIEL